ncbi:MAG TPA: hypothetical protein VLE19_13610 [Pyrinomonadaceae bacterium]|nr:hypothetical protein [Pyrinomonadaceae bacterium]
MTISTRLFGYAISLSFDKTIRVPIDKLSNEFAVRSMQDASDLPLQTNRPLIATAHTHDAIQKSLAQTFR